MVVAVEGAAGPAPGRRPPRSTTPLDPFTGPRSIFQGTPFAIALVMATALALLAWPLLWSAAPASARRVLCTLVALDMLTFA